MPGCGLLVLGGSWWSRKQGHFLALSFLLTAPYHPCKLGDPLPLWMEEGELRFPLSEGQVEKERKGCVKGQDALCLSKDANGERDCGGLERHPQD